MKLMLTLTTICLYLGISSAAVVVDGTQKEELSTGDNENITAILAVAANQQHLTHIVKLKAANIKNITGFDTSSFIKNHYNTFRGTQGGAKHELMAAGLSAAQQQEMSPDSMKSIDIGQDFRAVAGSFNPSFVKYLTALNDVEYVEPNQIYKAAILPTSSQPQPCTASQAKPSTLQDKKQRRPDSQKRGYITQANVPSWGIARINHRERDEDLSSYTADEAAGRGIHVYVFDSGINTKHPDFGGRAYMEASFIDYEDDVDHAGHGTHVAGTIGGNSYGVAKNAILHGVKILDRNGDGTTAALIQAISHITQIAEPGRSIINLSLTGPRSQTIDDALSMAVQLHGIPVFVSAGNSGDNACDYSPSANPDVFTVGASNQNDIVPSFSSFGECVRIYAPGTNITSTWLGDQSQTMDGTSMANPHVTGIAAMLMSEFKFDSANQVYEALMSIATPNILKSAHDQGRKKLLAYNGPERY